MLEQAIIDKANSVSIKELVSELNWKTDTTGNKIICPNPDHYYSDNTPGVVFNPQSNKYRCFRCNKSFDSIGFYRSASEIQGNSKTFNEAVSDLLDMIDEDSNVLFDSKKAIKSTNYKGIHLYKCMGYELEYLHQRGICLYDSYKYNGKVYTETTLNKMSDKEQEEIRKQGVFYRGIAHVLKKNRVYVKHSFDGVKNYICYEVKYDYDEDEELQERAHSMFENTDRSFVIAKSLDGQSKKNYGHIDFNFITDGMPMNEIYICEGMEDALTYTMNGKASISLNSVGNVNSLMDYFEQCYVPRYNQKIYLSLDNDAAGLNATQKLIDFFVEYNKNHKKQYRYAKVNISEKFKDINEYWVDKFNQS